MGVCVKKFCNFTCFIYIVSGVHVCIVYMFAVLFQSRVYVHMTC